MSRISTWPLHTLADLLIYELTFWFIGGEMLNSDEYPPTYTQLIQQQNTIGWEQMFSEWAQLQYDFLQDFRFVNKKEISHSLWAVSVTMQLLHVHGQNR